MLNWTSTSCSNSEGAAFDAMGAYQEGCCFAVGRCVADSVDCIFRDATAKVGRVALLAELANCPSREGDSGTDATATTGRLLDCAEGVSLISELPLLLVLVILMWL